MSDCEKCTYNNAGKLKTNCTHPRIHTASGVHDCRHYKPSVSKLESENAELRRLVYAMWDTHVRSKKKPTAYGWVAIQEQAEELGIELVRSKA